MQSASTLTFLFTDIEGSTRRWEASAGMHDSVEEHFHLLRVAIETAGGEIFATMGDGVAASFGSADSAAQAAVAAQLSLPSTGLPVRMGIHSGQAQRVGDDYRGRTLNRAARIAGCAHGGQVLVSETSAALLRAGRTGLGLTDLGVHHLRDLSAPEQLWQLVEPTLRQDFPPIRAGSGSDMTLPVRRSSLVGREEDVDTVAQLVDEHPLVTLVGMGGIGKTRLAIAAASALADRFDVVRFVDLSAIEATGCEAEFVTGAIPPIDAARRTLLVIDNCEQVLAAVSSALDRLLSTSDVHVLATSRERLDLEGEHVVAVRPLDPGTTALELFRARAHDAGLALSAEDDDIVKEICERVDGMPLAIELAAARVQGLGLPALRDALDDCLDVLGSRRREPDRHSTIGRTIEWSTHMLDEDERRLFEWMSVFVGGFELDAAAHVAQQLGIGAGRVLDIIDSLVAKSLVVVDHGRDGARYRMLWLLRAHALVSLEESDQRVRAFAAHAEWVATICDLPYTDPCSALVERRALRLERELDNWRQAAQWTIGRSGRRRTDRDGLGGNGLDAPGRSILIGRLCGPPTAHFLLGRHDLAELVGQLPALCVRPMDRYAARCAAATSTAGAGDASVLQDASEELELLEQGRPTGIATLLGWIACTWAGTIERGVDLVLAAADDERLSLDMRDLFLAIGTVDRFSLTSSTDRREELTQRCMAAAARTSVRTQRTACLLGVAWAVLGFDDERARDLVEVTLDEIPLLPSYVRQTLPGNVSRLLSVIDPDRAASDMASRIELVDPRDATFAELIPMVYAAALLERVGHPSAQAALQVLRSSRVASYVEILGLTGGEIGDGAVEMRTELAAVLDDLHAALIDTVVAPTLGDTTSVEAAGSVEVEAVEVASVEVAGSLGAGSVEAAGSLEAAASVQAAPIEAALVDSESR